MSNKYASIIEEQGGSYPSESLHAPKLSELQLNEIEVRLGHQLPKDYREFLQDYAGINLEFAEFELSRDGHQDEASIWIFYGSGIADTYYFVQDNLKNEVETAWYPGVNLIKETAASEIMSWPEELLPIGCDMGGDQICLALFGLRPHALFWWRSNPWPDCQNLYLIADSFDEFMQMIYKAG